MVIMALRTFHLLLIINHAVSHAERRYVDDGCHTEGATNDDFIGSFQGPDFRAGVRCCSLDGLTCDTPGSCPGSFSYREAEIQCSDIGHRVCTKDELLSEVCCQTGGACDQHPVWTSTLESESGILLSLHFLNCNHFILMR